MTASAGRWLASGIVAGLAVGALIYLGAGALAGPGWACSDEQLGSEHSDLAPTGGSKDRATALAEWARVAAADGIAKEDALLRAIASTSGQDRYESDTGRIVIDGDKLAEVSLTQLDDGTWAVGSATYCMPPPEAPFGSPGPTPADGAT